MIISKQDAAYLMEDRAPHPAVYAAVGDYCAASGPPMTIGRCVIALMLGERLRAKYGTAAALPDEVDISAWRESFAADSAEAKAHFSRLFRRD